MEEAIWDDPRLWVAAAFVVFLALTYKKLSSFLLGALDSRSSRIKAELEDARRLREEAQAVLTDYKQKQAQYLKEAETMLETARENSRLIAQDAQRELKIAMDARTKQAMDKIEQEEAKAINEVRNHVVDIAMAAARAVIIEQVSHMSQDELIKLAVTDIERKIH